MTNTLSEHIHRTKHIYHNEGLISCINRGFSFIRGYLFGSGAIYVYKRTIGRESEKNYIPKNQGITFRVIYSNQQADELVSSGFDDFRFYIFSSKKRLNKGVIACCVYVKKSLAHIRWVALNNESLKALVPYPFEVNFLHGEACSEDAFTIPTFRGQGFSRYARYMTQQLLIRNGVTTLKQTTRVGDIKGQDTQKREGYKRCSEVRFTNTLWWKRCKETPITTSN